MATHFGLTADTLAAIQKVFTTFPQIGQVIIYGSRAKGTCKTGSDIDLTLVPPTGKVLDLTIQFRIEEALEALMLPYEFDLSILEKIENPELLNHIHRVGRVFYQRPT